MVGKSDQLIKIGQDAVEGDYYSTHYSPEINRRKEQKTSSPPIKNVFHNPDGTPKTPDAMAATRLLIPPMILADAIKRANSTDWPRKVRDALAATKDFDGVTGKDHYQ